MKSGNQEQICVKLDMSVLASLELECGISGLPRNRIVNRALIAYTLLIDETRSYKNGLVSKDNLIKWFLGRYSKWLTDPSGTMSLIVSKDRD